MSKKLTSILVFSAVFLFGGKALAFPIPTFSPSEIAQEIQTYLSQISMEKSELENTRKLFTEGVLAGVPGYLHSIETGDINGLNKNLANDAFKKAKAEYEKKKKAKEEAQKESNEKAEEIAEANKEGEAAAKKAVDENRETASENKKAKFKKALSWAGKQASKNRGKVEGLTGKLLKNSQASSAMGKAFDVLDKQIEKEDAKEEEEKNKKDNGNDNKSKES